MSETAIAEQRASAAAERHRQEHVAAMAEAEALRAFIPAVRRVLAAANAEHAQEQALDGMPLDNLGRIHSGLWLRSHSERAGLAVEGERGWRWCACCGRFWGEPVFCHGDTERCLPQLRNAARRAGVL